MSYTETHIGQFCEIVLPDSTDLNKWLLKQGVVLENTTIKNNYSIYKDDKYNPKVIITKSNRIFIIEDSQLDDDKESLHMIIPKNRCEYRYVFKFYNGGTSFDEMLEEELDKVEF